MVSYHSNSTCKYKTKLCKACGRKTAKQTDAKPNYHSVYCLHLSNTLLQLKQYIKTLFLAYLFEYTTQIHIGGASI